MLFIIQMLIAEQKQGVTLEEITQGSEDLRLLRVMEADEADGAAGSSDPNCCYLCNQCSRSFASLEELESHLASHLSSATERYKGIHFIYSSV